MMCDHLEMNDPNRREPLASTWRIGGMMVKPNQNNSVIPDQISPEADHDAAAFGHFDFSFCQISTNARANSCGFSCTQRDFFRREPVAALDFLGDAR